MIELLEPGRTTGGCRCFPLGSVVDRAMAGQVKSKCIHQQNGILLAELEIVHTITTSTSSILVSHLAAGDLSCASLQKVEIVMPEFIWHRK